MVGFSVKQSHEHGVCHGDIKCENVLVTSWNWLYLADFASFKPTYIPHDDPSDFSFFFDTGGRRRCYLAPEHQEVHHCLLSVYKFTLSYDRKLLLIMCPMSLSLQSKPFDKHLESQDQLLWFGEINDKNLKFIDEKKLMDSKLKMMAKRKK
ncbi:hypothetical protein RHMOL_Rhmol07G0280800 [Rhododendron molle]|uniref:Uncharacterized protein n=1 Tax=Rhododendron molle TaxID=49168 RepID=A0ACC0N638_RHOML|nr:hypothetical protein RHMOL_Rhmol07G0280800 [Rhododendron molle]